MMSDWRFEKQKGSDFGTVFKDGAVVVRVHGMQVTVEETRKKLVVRDVPRGLWYFDFVRPVSGAELSAIVAMLPGE